MLFWFVGLPALLCWLWWGLQFCAMSREYRHETIQNVVEQIHHHHQKLVRTGSSFHEAGLTKWPSEHGFRTVWGGTGFNSSATKPQPCAALFDFSLATASCASLSVHLGSIKTCGLLILTVLPEKYFGQVSRKFICRWMLHDCPAK